MAINSTTKNIGFHPFEDLRLHRTSVLGKWVFRAFLQFEGLADATAIPG
jgi:hypothetical protein